MTSGVEVLVNVGPLDEALSTHPERRTEPLQGLLGAGAGTLIEAAVRHVLEQSGIDAADVSVTLLDDSAIRDMNRDYLERDRVTDVIAFTLDSGAGEEPLMGDVYLGAEQAVRQAEELGVPVLEEIARLAIHGTLHVLGYDHPEGPERVDSEMFRSQERLLQDVIARG